MLPIRPRVAGDRVTLPFDRSVTGTVLWVDPIDQGITVHWDDDFITTQYALTLIAA